MENLSSQETFLKEIRFKFDYLSRRLKTVLEGFLEHTKALNDSEFVSACVNSPFATHFGSVRIPAESQLVSPLLQNDRNVWEPIRKIIEQRVFFFLREVLELEQYEICDPSKIMQPTGKGRALLLNLVVTDAMQEEIRALVSKYTIPGPDDSVLKTCLKDISEDGEYKTYRTIYWRVCDPDIYALFLDLAPHAEALGRKEYRTVLKFTKDRILELRLEDRSKNGAYGKFDSVANMWWALRVLYVQGVYDSDVAKFQQLGNKLLEWTKNSFTGYGSDERIKNFRPELNVTPELFDDRWAACFSAINVMGIIKHSLSNGNMTNAFRKKLSTLLRDDLLAKHVLKRDEDGLIYYYALKLRCVNQYLADHLKDELEVFYPGKEILDYKNSNPKTNVFNSDLSEFRVWTRTRKKTVGLYSEGDGFKKRFNKCADEIRAYSSAIRGNGKRESLKPLTIFLCAEPGSGKSHLVREIGNTVSDRRMLDDGVSFGELADGTHIPSGIGLGSKRAVIVDLNLSQVSSWKEVHRWLVATGTVLSKYPKLLILLFFDEIDSLPKNVDIYARLLGPMADGKLLLADKLNSVLCTPAIWFFAASKVKNFADLRRVLKSQAINKGEDFMSRITHSINMPSYAPPANWKERVLITRSILSQYEMKFTNKTEEGKVLERFALGMGNITSARRIKQIIDRVRQSKTSNLLLKDFQELR